MPADALDAQYDVATPYASGASYAAELREVHVSATSWYDVGRITGEAMRETIQASVRVSKGVARLEAYASTPEGASIVEGFRKLHEEVYPHHMDEVRGLADGSQMPFLTIMLNNMVQELSQRVPVGDTPAEPADPASKEEQGCTDFHGLAKGRLSAWGHNEDAGAGGYIVHCNLQPRDGAAVQYSAFAYPGCIAGWAWGANANGVAQSINALSAVLTPDRHAQPGLCANFVAADVLQASDLADAVTRATIEGQAGGQHFNLASLEDPELHLSIETSPTGCSVVEMRPPSDTEPALWYGHANAYLRLTEHEAKLGDSLSSSLVRVQRVEALTCPGSALAISTAPSIDDVIAVESDTDGSEPYPIFRRGEAPDYGASHHTVVFDMLAGTMHVYCNARGRPSECEPSMVLTIGGAVAASGDAPAVAAESASNL